jgi:hypothetical protein
MQGFIMNQYDKKSELSAIFSGSLPRQISTKSLNDLWDAH